MSLNAHRDAHRKDGAQERPCSMARVGLSLSVLAAVTALGVLATAAPAAAEERHHQASSIAESAVRHAKQQVGKPYRFGGSGPSAFDCSGLVQWSYAQAGKSLPRTTYTQYDTGSAVSRSNLRPGDLVFFYSGPSHVGMYIGDGRMVHAPSSGKKVQIVSMAGYYNRQLVGARRVA